MNDIYTQETINYYNMNVSDYITDTVAADMVSLQSLFLSYVHPDTKILDLGCGSGRDSKAFIDKGYDVTSVDGSIEMCKATTLLTGKKTICSTFQSFSSDERYGGIWASASLLHLELQEIISVVTRLSGNLLPDGCFYMSFKMGDYAGMRNGRYFQDFNEHNFRDSMGIITSLDLVKIIETCDVRPGRQNEKWLNAFFVKRVI